MLVRTLLNRVHPLQSFVYSRVDRVDDTLLVTVVPRKNARPRCRGCGKKGPTYDTARKPQRFQFVPLWGLACVLLFAPRRVECRSCGIGTEQMPWADGKHRACNVFRLFLAQWARRMSWTEVARVFDVSWGVVYRSIAWVVDYGLLHRNLQGVQAVGVDEMAIWSGHRYVTVVYQIDQQCRRLLWVGKDRTEATLQGFFDMFGAARSHALQFVASDMWKPFLKVVARNAVNAINVLDRFHIVAKLHKAVDEVRAKEARELTRKGRGGILKHARWCLLKNPASLTDAQYAKMSDLLTYNLKAVRAYLLKDAFNLFWTYTSPRWAAWFLDRWCTRAMRSRLEPMKRFARTLRAHRELLLNWFIAKKAISSGVVEALNGNAKFAIRKSRGFRSYDVLRIALYHHQGRLPEPEFAHRF